MDKVYFAIDLKSFYASVECVERGLNPLTTNLVVADESRSEKTICLAVSPSLKKYGIPGRIRLFELNAKIKEINKSRKINAERHYFKGKSSNDIELENNNGLELDYIIATPRMKKYMEISSKIYSIYLKYFDSEDIHVYSIDEVFIDVTPYIDTYGLTPHDLARKVIGDILKQTGITATAGIGTNLYLAKVAMDIVAKHIPADKDGVRIAELDEQKYREMLWDHRPLRDFWRVGKGYVERLEKRGLYTMGDIAKQSIEDEDILYEEFGINAELLIDHAWGYEPCTMKDIKSYTPENTSISIGQVLSHPYTFEKGLIIIKEMAEQIALDLTRKNLLTNQIVLSLGYDISDLNAEYSGDVKEDYIGRILPKGAHKSINFQDFTRSVTIIRDGAVKLYRQIMNKNLHLRRVSITASIIITDCEAKTLGRSHEQLNLFYDYELIERERDISKKKSEKEMALQDAIIKIQDKYGKNSVVKVADLEEGGTTIERNKQVGGHKA